MIINSEQEMIGFGIDFAKRLISTGDAAGGTPAARSRQASTVGETAAAGPASKNILMVDNYDWFKDINFIPFFQISLIHFINLYCG